MIYVFVDTNFFMQHKKYDALPWSELFSENVSIVIPRKVIGEIDKHKNSNNSRLSKRAKSFTSLLKDLRDQDKSIELGGLSITISISDRFDTAVPRKDFLNLSDPDDCIVNEILCWIEKNPTEKHCALCGDIKMTLTCDDCDIPYKDIPESWRLETEADEKDKEIAKLKKVISRAPKIEIRTDKRLIDVDVPVYQPLTDEQVLTLGRTLFEAFPEQKKFETPPQKGQAPYLDIQLVSGSFGAEQWIYPTKKGIDKYSSEYQSWKKQTIDTLAQAHLRLKNQVTRFELCAQIINDGSCPAHDVEILIETSGNIFLLPTISRRREWLWGHERLGITTPPEPPKKERAVSVCPVTQDPTDIASLLKGPSFPEQYEVNELYVKNIRKEPSTSWELSCKELRHQMGDVSFDLPLFIPENGYTHDLAIDITVSASNTAEPISQKIQVRPKKIEGELYLRLSQTLDEFIKKYRKEEPRPGVIRPFVLGPKLFKDDDEDKPVLF